MSSINGGIAVNFLVQRVPHPDKLFLGKGRMGAHQQQRGKIIPFVQRRLPVREGVERKAVSLIESDAPDGKSAVRRFHFQNHRLLGLGHKLPQHLAAKSQIPAGGGDSKMLYITEGWKIPGGNDPQQFLIFRRSKQAVTGMKQKTLLACKVPLFVGGKALTKQFVDWTKYRLDFFCLRQNGAIGGLHDTKNLRRNR